MPDLIPTDFEPNIQNAIRALIVRDNKVLMIKKVYEDGSQKYALPGGVQQTGETLATALARESKEKLATDIKVNTLLHVADWLKPCNNTPPTTRHLVEFLFACDVDESYQPQNGLRPDKHQVEVVWVKLDELKDINCHPNSMAAFVVNTRQKISTVTP